MQLHHQQQQSQLQGISSLQQQQKNFPSSLSPNINIVPDEEVVIFQLIQQLLNPITREPALLDLSKRRETYEDMAPLLWNSFGTVG